MKPSVCPAACPAAENVSKKAALPVWQSRCVFACPENRYARLSAKAGVNRQTVSASCKQRRNSNRQSANQGNKKDGYERNRIRQACRHKGRATRSAACPCPACRNICGCSHVAISFGLVLDEQSLAYRRPKRKGFSAIFQSSAFYTKRLKTDSVFFVVFAVVFGARRPPTLQKNAADGAIFCAAGSFPHRRIVL